MFMTLLLAAIIAYVLIGLLFVASAVVMAGRVAAPAAGARSGTVHSTTPAAHLSRLLVAHRVPVAVEDHHHLAARPRPARSRRRRSRTTSPRTRYSEPSSCSTTAPGGQRSTSPIAAIRSGSRAASAGRTARAAAGSPAGWRRRQGRDQPEPAAATWPSTGTPPGCPRAPGPRRSRPRPRRRTPPCRPRRSTASGRGRSSSGNRKPSQYWGSSSGVSTRGRRASTVRSVPGPVDPPRGPGAVQDRQVDERARGRRPGSAPRPAAAAHAGCHGRAPGVGVHELRQRLATPDPVLAAPGALVDVVGRAASADRDPAQHRVVRGYAEARGDGRPVEARRTGARAGPSTAACRVMCAAAWPRS